MRAKVLACVLSSAAAFLFSGCYTVLQSPYAVSDVREEQRKLDQWEDRSAADHSHAGLGQFDDDSYGYYGYPGAPSYGGFPIFGTGNSYGGYGSPYYGSGNSPYGYGNDPYYYGNDPYYYGSNGTYVPPGYELVTINELERLRSIDGTIGNAPQATPADLEARRQEKRRQQLNTWQSRNSPTVRKAPTPTPKTVSNTAPSRTSTKSATTTKSAPKSSSGKASKTSAKPRKTRR